MQRLGDILRSIDARLVIIGSLAPDILDRPLGMWVLPESLDPTSRGFGHVLLVNVLLIVLSVVVLRWTGLRAPLVFFLAAAGHMLLDRMWESLDTVLWPIRGTSFGAAEYDLSPSWLHWLQSGASSFVPEALGGLSPGHRRSVALPAADAHQLAQDWRWMKASHSDIGRPAAGKWVS